MKDGQYAGRGSQTKVIFKIKKKLQTNIGGGIHFILFALITHCL